MGLSVIYCPQVLFVCHLIFRIALQNWILFLPYKKKTEALVSQSYISVKFSSCFALKGWWSIVYLFILELEEIIVIVSGS